MNNYIVDIDDKISITNNDSYIKNFYECKIKNIEISSWLTPLTMSCSKA